MPGIEDSDDEGEPSRWWKAQTASGRINNDESDNESDDDVGVADSETAGGDRLYPRDHLHPYRRVAHSDSGCSDIRVAQTSGEVVAGTAVSGTTVARTDVPGTTVPGTTVPGTTVTRTDVPGTSVP
jgi:hypothetical protein